MIQFKILLFNIQYYDIWRSERRITHQIMGAEGIAGTDSLTH